MCQGYAGRLKRRNLPPKDSKNRFDSDHKDSALAARVRGTVSEPGSAATLHRKLHPTWFAQVPCHARLPPRSSDAPSRCGRYRGPADGPNIEGTPGTLEKLTAATLKDSNSSKLRRPPSAGNIASARTFGLRIRPLYAQRHEMLVHEVLLQEFRGL